MRAKLLAPVVSLLAVASTYLACGHEWGRFDFSKPLDASAGDAKTGGSGGATGGKGGTSTGGAGNTDGGGSTGCSNLKKDGSETDVDCGGQCKTCGDGKTCSTGSDCASGFCVDSTCCNTSCADPCYACNVASAPGKCTPIAAGTDPQNECPTTDNCDGAGKCECYNGKLDGSETGVDCGGSCPPCGGTCGDNILNNGESDTDCGGPNCAKCGNGRNCASPNDCSSNVCDTGKCCGPDPVGTTCAAKDCGNVQNNCGQSISCGPACAPPDSCISNVCQCQDDGTACNGMACGSATNNCGAQVPCGNCTSPQVCYQNACLDCTPGDTQACQCNGTETCSDAGAFGACTGSADTQNDIANCGTCGNCCVPGCGAPSSDYQCKCGQCYYAPTDCMDCASLTGCALTACQAAGAC